MGYDDAFLEREIDETHLREVTSDFPDLVPSTDDIPEWQSHALAIWPDLRRDLLEWDALSLERQDAVALAVFAVATILDDSRFLLWAASRADALAREFAFVRAPDAKTSEASAEKPQAPYRDEPQPAEATPNGGVGDVIQKWEQTCTMVAHCASTAGGDPPRPERLQELRDQVRVLDQLHDEVVAFLDANRPEKLVATISDTVMAVAEEHDASWLRGAADQIHAQWKLIWLTGGAANVEPLRADVGRATRALPAAVNDWRTHEDARDSLGAQLTELRTQPRGNIASQLSASDRETTLQEEVARAARRAHECMMNLLRVVAPEGYEFEPSRDYEREWLTVEAASDSTDGEVKQEAANQLRRRAVADGTVEGMPIGSVPEVDAGAVGEGRKDDVSSSDEPATRPSGGSARPAPSDDGPTATHDDEEKSESP